MKKMFLVILMFAGLFIASLAIPFPSQLVHAQNGGTIELNLGQAAKDQEVVGTANYDPSSGTAGFGKLISQLLNAVVIIGALMLFIYLLWGGIEWITSGGDKGKTESARNKITSAIVGLIVLAASWAILGLILRFLNAGDINTLIDTL